jgi:hypothetical protein
MYILDNKASAKQSLPVQNTIFIGSTQNASGYPRPIKVIHQSLIFASFMAKGFIGEYFHW